MARWRRRPARTATRAVRVLAALAMLSLTSAIVTLPVQTDVVRAEPATFDPVESIGLGAGTAFGRVVTNGRGTVLTVARERDPSQQIVVRRSVDGGQDWTVTARLAGTDGAATRPWAAIDGDVAAVSFLGLWCEPGPSPVCHESPYLTVSTDAGRTWAAPVRVAQQAFEVRVAVDDDRVWMLWDESGGWVQLRGLEHRDLHRPFVARQYVGGLPHLAAADGMMVAAFRQWNAATSASSVAALVADGRAVRAGRIVFDGELGHFQSSVATAAGRAHVVVADPVSADSARVLVTSAGRDGVFGTPVPIGPRGNTAAIAAVAGTVVVAVADRTGLTSVSTSSDDGETFSPPLTVAQTAGRDPLVEIGIARPPAGLPRARFDWTVPARYVDTDADELPDGATDATAVAAGQRLTVTLDGCRSIGGDGRTVAKYTWLVDGELHDIGPDACRSELELDDDATATVRLVVENDLGDTASTEQPVMPRDHLIVSIGDSVASGEGSPHVDAARLPTGPGAVWGDRACHRSTYAGPALAARRLEDADPRSSVTFVHLACSGAAISDVPAGSGTSDDPETGGVLDGYHGVEPAPGSLRPGQLDQMSALVGGRTVDALLLSVGANDAEFSSVVKGCMLEVDHCDESSVRTGFEERLATLADRYGRLGAAFGSRGIAADRVHITEYFDPTIADLGFPTLRCQPFIDDDEARWAHTDVITGLNGAVRSAAVQHGWRFVGGIAERFHRHGYCASDSWVVDLPESVLVQRDEKGAFHPNRAGQRVYGDALFADLRSTLVVPPAAAVGDAVGVFGDIVVITSTVSEVTSVALHTTGGVPVPQPPRRLDRVVAGDGYLAVSGPPAVDNTLALGAWHEMSGLGAVEPEIRLAVIATRPNVAVRRVDIVQAPADSRTLVAGRDSLVQATIDASISGRQPIEITTTVTAFGPTGAERQVVEITESVSLNPGRNLVLLPKDAAFRADGGERLTAVVEVNDPPGSAPGDTFDDRSGTDDDRRVVAGRGLSLLIGDAYVGSGSVSCNDLRGAAERLVAYARAALPVTDVDVEMFCGFRLPVEPTEQYLLETLLFLDEISRRTGIDNTTVVVPPGWLQAAAGDAVGVAAHGLRGAIVESGAPSEALAHELAHTYGLDHTTGFVRASGALVSRRQARAGSDWMAPVAQPRSWTGGATWDTLLDVIGGPDRAPIAVDEDGPGEWITGAVTRAPDGTWTLEPGRWVPDVAPASPTTDPIVPGSLDLSRLTAQQLDADGRPLADPIPIGLGTAGALMADGAPVEFGAVFATQVSLMPGAAAVRLVLDGTIERTVPLNGPPTITIERPSAGLHVPRGEPLTVAWTASDPDGDPLEFDVYVSDDAGLSWAPLDAEATGSEITVPMPADVGGDAVRVMAVATDGTRSATAISAVFSAEPDATVGDERIVFIREEYPNRWPGPTRVMTMAPDGSEVTEVPLPGFSELSSYGTCAPEACPARYTDPVWANRGAEIVFSSDLLLTEFEGTIDEIRARSDWDPGHRLYSVNADGTGLRRITAPGFDASYWPTDAGGRSLGDADSVCPNVSPDGTKLAWWGLGSPHYSSGQHLWMATRTPTGWSTPTLLWSRDAAPPLLNPSFGPQATPPTLSLGHDPTGTDREGCPEWAPDGQSVVVVGTSLRYQFDDGGTPASRFDYSPIVRIPVDGSAITVISPEPAFQRGTGAYASFWYQLDFNMSVDWPATGPLVVNRGVLAPGATFGGLVPGPERFGVFDFDATTGAFTRRTPEPDRAWPEHLIRARVGPGGQVYGRVPGTPECVFRPLVLAIADLVVGGVDPVVPENPAAICPITDRQWDWAVVAGGAGSTGLPLVAPPEPDAAPDPGSPPEELDATEVLAPDDIASDGADEPAGSPAEAAPIGPVTVPAGRPTTIRLATVDGSPAVFEVVVPPAADELVVASTRSGIAPISTDLGGELIVTPQPGFRGMTTFQVATRGGSAPATVTLEVVGNSGPIARDDEVDVTAGVETVLDPGVLLANDSDPDAGDTTGGAPSAGGLQVVAVFGSTSGRAWLGAEGGIHVRPGAVGPSTFSYSVADDGGDVATATVRVESLAPPSGSTTDAPVSTVPTSTAQPATNTTLAGGSGSTDPAAPSGPYPGRLPSTGSERSSLIPAAVVSVLIGVALVAASRRRSSVSPGGGHR